MVEKCDICDKEAGIKGQKYCTVSWRKNWEKLFGCRGKELPLKGEIYLCKEHNEEYENNCRGKEEEAQKKKDYKRTFGTEEPSISQLRNHYLKSESIFGKNDNEKPWKALSSQWKSIFQSILQDPLLDNEDALISATHLISHSGLSEKANLNDKEQEKEIKSDSYFCEKLTRFRNSPSDSAAGKTWQVLIKHGIPLDKYYKLLKNNQEKKQQQSQFTKRRVIDSIQDWGIEVYRKEGKKSTFDRIINQKNRFDYLEKNEVEEKDWQEIISLLNGKELKKENSRWPTAEEYQEWVLEINPETRQPWDPPLTEQQKKVIQDPVLTSPGTRPFHPPKKEDLENPHYSVPDITVETIREVLEFFSYLQKAQEQIEECMAKNSFWSGPAEYYTFQKLENIQKAPADTDLGKVRQALENNGFSLTNEINKLNDKAKSKSRELKERIIKNLTDYGIDSNQLTDSFSNFNDRYASINKFFLTSEDCQQAKQAIIKNITQHKREWRIVKRRVPVSPGGYVKLIVNKSGNYHYEGGFTKQEWQELEKSLGGKFSNSPFWIILVVVGLLFSSSLFLLWWTKKKKK